MDYDQTQDSNGGINNQPPIYTQTPLGPPSRKSGWSIFWGIMFGVSLIGNMLLFVILIAVAIAAAAGSGRGHRIEYVEYFLREGPRHTRIAVVPVVGVINGEIATDAIAQLRMAAEDESVAAVILRVNSPGGGVTPSDEIYNEINRFREETGKPVVAFMQGLAASGGYYSSVACDVIMAEPTTITGSIGVIMAYMVVEDLFTGKLGIQPVVVKSGSKKDWPSSFRPPTEEERAYLDEKLIQPAYERFVQLVNDGRTELSLEEVRTLADGSIYGAEEALNNKLIDEIGYLDEAIELTKILANIDHAEVIEYRRALTLASLLGAEKNVFPKIDKNMIYEMTVPRLMYLWSGY